MGTLLKPTRKMNGDWQLLQNPTSPARDKSHEKKLHHTKDSPCLGRVLAHHTALLKKHLQTAWDLVSQTRLWQLVRQRDRVSSWHCLLAKKKSAMGVTQSVGVATSYNSEKIRITSMIESSRARAPKHTNNDSKQESDTLNREVHK